jgi:hypothetical protein
MMSIVSGIIFGRSAVSVQPKMMPIIIECRLYSICSLMQHCHFLPFIGGLHSSLLRTLDTSTIANQMLKEILAGGPLAEQVSQSREAAVKNISEMSIGNTYAKKPPSDDPKVNNVRERAMRYRKNKERKEKGEAPIHHKKGQRKPLSEDDNINYRRTSQRERDSHCAENKKRKARGEDPIHHSIEPFPEKLHRLLLEVEAAGRSDVISFVAHGRAFAIHKPDKFFSLLPSE